MSEKSIKELVHSIFVSATDIAVTVASYALAAWCLCSLWPLIPELVPGVSRALEMVPDIGFQKAIGLIFFSHIVFSKIFRPDTQFSTFMAEKEAKKSK